MKTRRIFLQPGECVEIVNTYGTSILKVTGRFMGFLPCAVVYEQPDVITLDPAAAKEHKVTYEPVMVAADLTEQNGLDPIAKPF